jgi:protein-S-isoprenylcysteine O-methyltransferase Ste14
VTFWSWAALLLLAGNAVWFHRRVRRDERRLHRLFGRDFEEYRDRVKRWVPGVL